MSNTGSLSTIESQRGHDELADQRKELEKELKALEVQLEDIGDTDIHALRSTKQDYIAHAIV